MPKTVLLAGKKLPAYGTKMYAGESILNTEVARMTVVVERVPPLLIVRLLFHVHAAALNYLLIVRRTEPYISILTMALVRQHALVPL
jgi:hypothetical protein